MKAISKVVLLGLCGLLWISSGTAATMTVTNLNEDFASIADWPTTFGTPPFLVTTDGGRTVIASTNATGPSGGYSIMRRTDLGPVDAEIGPLAINVTYREISAGDPTPPVLTLQRAAADPIVAGNLSQVQILPRGNGTFQFIVRKFIDNAGTEQVVVNVATAQTFPTSYFTLSVTRTNGVWQGFRDDTSSIIFTATESSIASGGLLGNFEFRDTSFTDGSATTRYFDNLLVTSTIPEPTTSALVGAGSAVLMLFRRRK